MPSSRKHYFVHRDSVLHARELPRFFKAVLLPLYKSHGEDTLRALFDWCEAPQRTRQYTKECFCADGDEEVTSSNSLLNPASDGVSTVELLEIIDSKARRTVKDVVNEVLLSSVTDFSGFDLDDVDESEDLVDFKNRQLNETLDETSKKIEREVDELEHVFELLLEKWLENENKDFESDLPTAQKVMKSFDLCLLFDVKEGKGISIGTPNT